jgi:site-specific DNA-methyltransferase (adenine-specific)
MKPYKRKEVIGNCTLYLGDCTKVISKLDGFSVILTDPPYGIDYQSNMRTKTKQFDKIENDSNQMRLGIYSQLYEKSNENSIIITFCSFKNYAYDYIYLNDIYKIKNCIIWDKGGGGIGDLEGSLSTDFEMAIIAHKGIRKIYDKRIGSVWKVNKVPPSNMVHPTEKPIELIKQLLINFSCKNDVIIDPFMGSGTTGIACLQLNRKFIGIEIEEKYFDIACNRIASANLEPWKYNKSRLNLFEEFNK